MGRDGSGDEGARATRTTSTTDAVVATNTNSPRPADDGLEEGARAGAECGTAGHGAEQPAQGAPSLPVLEDVAEDGERDRDDAARAHRSDQAGGDEPAGRRDGAAVATVRMAKAASDERMTNMRSTRSDSGPQISVAAP